jgi:hypothetical protein
MGRTWFIALTFGLLIGWIQLLPYENVEPDLYKYYKMFKLEARQRQVKFHHGVHVAWSGDLGKGADNTNTLGICGEDPLHEVPMVSIDKQDFKTLTPSQQEELMFHEFGHCLLDQDHRDELYPDGRHKSVMHSSISRGNEYFDHRKEYLDELFFLTK